VGHSTVVVEMDGARLLTDPLLRRRVGHLLRASAVAEVGDVDAVLVSHAHHDHLDLSSLGRVSAEVPVVVPRGIGRVVKSRANVIEAVEGDELTFGAVTVRATHAVHEGRRAGRRAEGAALGYAITGSQRVYFAGDTDLFPEMEGLVPDLDVALIPIWGWGPSLGRGLHLDPRRAAEALQLLKPRIAIPIHWGTYRPIPLRSRAPFLHEPPEAFAEAASELAPEVDVRILQPGESYSFDDPRAPRSETPKS
jgi:L-ascorbate metabolism protein UlaG (beta-lactamase superfamily)